MPAVGKRVCNVPDSQESWVQRRHKYLAAAARVRDAANASTAVADHFLTYASNVVEGWLLMETRPRRERILGRFSLGLGSTQSHILMHDTKPRCSLGICHAHSGKGRAW